jgi:hypothetical protein
VAAVTVPQPCPIIHKFKTQLQAAIAAAAVSQETIFGKGTAWLRSSKKESAAAETRNGAQI